MIRWETFRGDSKPLGLLSLSVSSSRRDAHPSREGGRPFGQGGQPRLCRIDVRPEAVALSPPFTATVRANLRLINGRLRARSTPTFAYRAWAAIAPITRLGIIVVKPESTRWFRAVSYTHLTLPTIYSV